MHKTLLILAGSLLAVQANSAKAGPNLIVNGDFGAGNTGFTSQYAFVPAICFQPTPTTLLRTRMRTTALGRIQGPLLATVRRTC
jgi:hypothetical protein